jgi:hypothetical protein
VNRLEELARDFSNFKAEIYEKLKDSNTNLLDLYSIAEQNKIESIEKSRVF